MSKSFAKSKKGFEILTAWVEIFFIVFIVLGALLGFLIRNAALSYTILFLFGLVTGTVLYNKRSVSLFPYILLVSGFAIGYIVGNRVADIFVLLALFITGNITSYQIFDKKLFGKTF